MPVSKKELKEALDAMSGVLRYSRQRDSDRNSAQHLAKSLVENGDVSRLEALKELFLKAYEHTEESYTSFWVWYRDHRISNLDEAVYITYKALLEESGLPGRVNLNNFSGRGERLWKRLSSWAGETSTEMCDILIDYFRCNIVVAKSFKDGNRAVLYNAKSLMEDFGWNNWEDWLERTGGEGTYLKPPESALKAYAEERSMLEEIGKRRQAALDNTDIKEYDRLGKLLAAKGVRETYKELGL